MRLPELVIKNYQFTIVVFILLFVAGLFSYFNMPRSENPEVSMPGSNVVAIYPGTNPIDIEQLVVTPIEDAINELEDIKRIETKINDGLAVLQVEFTFGTDPDEKYDKVLQQVNSVQNDLPDDLYKLDVQRWQVSDVCMMQLALVSENAEYSTLYDKAEILEKELKKIKSVKKVEIWACPQQEVRISLKLEQMAQMNITADQITSAINSNNANIPGGAVKLDDKSFGLKSSGSFAHLDEIRNMVVSSYNGQLIYLKNVADVEFKYQEQNYFAQYNGERAIFVAIKQKEGKNIFKTTEKIEKKLTAFKTSLNEDIRLERVFDQAEEVDTRISGFENNLFQGIALVGVVILLALGFRSAMVVIFAIPLSIVVGLAFVDYLGFGLEQMSIAGLVVALGLLVDNSIVMTENINRYIKLGRKPIKAAIDGASEISWPVISATVTTLLAFIPIIMMPEGVGQFIRGMPVTIISTLIISLLVALTLTPMIAGKFFKGKKQSEEQTENPEEKENTKNKKAILKNFANGPYRKLLSWTLRYKWVTMLITIAVFIGSLMMFGRVGVSFFPKAEKPQFRIEIELPEGTNIDKTHDVTLKVEKILRNIKEVKYFASNIGHGNPRIYYNVFSRNYTPTFAEIFIKLQDMSPPEFDAFLERIKPKMKIAGAKVRIKEFEQGPMMEAPVMLYVNGDNLSQLHTIAEDVEKMLEKQDGIINIENEISRKRMDLHVNINKEKAGMLGVPIFQLERTIRMAVSGLPISTFRDTDGDEYEIVLQMPFEEKFMLSDFDKIYVPSLSGKQIPLKQLVNIELKEAPGMIRRLDFTRSALISADLEKGANLDKVMNPVLKQLDEYNFPEGYSYSVRGELETREDSFGGMQIAIIIALISIFAVLVLQFRSFAQPLIIFAAIPLALIGSIWGLYVTNYTFSFMAFIGITSLIGIVINNSIILVDFTNQLISKGEKLIDAIKIAATVRFTPIILTTLTTLGGLLPLTIQGGSMWAPMGIAIIGGLLVSTLLTLIVVPVLYGMLTKEVKTRI